MLLFKISYLSDKKSHTFSDVKKFMTLMNTLHAERFFAEVYKHSKEAAQHAPDYHCVQYLCWHLPPKFEHTFLLKFQCANADDMVLFSSLYRNFCSLSSYTFELISLD